VVGFTLTVTLKNPPFPPFIKGGSGQACPVEVTYDSK